ncbi:hypothetical protein SUGI_1089600 [Cryptomeria japonica]|nr:hypothetical protein SUGI_1089600 [Cryptomeria japonica]
MVRLLYHLQLPELIFICRTEINSFGETIEEVRHFLVSTNGALNYSLLPQQTTPSADWIKSCIRLTYSERMLSSFSWHTSIAIRFLKITSVVSDTYTTGRNRVFSFLSKQSLADGTPLYGLNFIPF